MDDKLISKYESDLTCMDVDELYEEYRRRVRNIAALEVIIDDLKAVLGETMTELDNMKAEKASELGRVSTIHAELIKKEKASD